jgi:hypothetical protein
MVKDVPPNTDTLDGFANLDHESGSPADDSKPGLPPVISFEDILAQDETHRSRLESIIERGRRGRGALPLVEQRLPSRSFPMTKRPPCVARRMIGDCARLPSVLT